MKQDPKLVAAKQSNESEVKYIAAKYKIPVGIVRKTMKEVSGTGKPCRSRVMIYAGLRALGYIIPQKKK